MPLRRLGAYARRLPRCPKLESAAVEGPECALLHYAFRAFPRPIALRFPLS